MRLHTTWLVVLLPLWGCAGRASSDEPMNPSEAGAPETSAPETSRLETTADDTTSDVATEDVVTEDVASADGAREDVTPGLEVGAADAGACGCSSFTSPASVGFIGFGLKETSGLAASRKNPGILYGHNDSGDSARVFALDAKGGQLGQLDLSGATAVDWEDIAVGPCGGTTCVFVGDFGDNGASRSNYAIYAFDEPTLDGKLFPTKTVPAKKYPFAYPDGSHNCETLLAHPTTGELFVVTKTGSSEGAVYKFPSPLIAGTTATLTKVGAAKGTAGHLVTGGDISPCGDRVLLRTDDPGTASLILSYALAPGSTVPAALATDPSSLPAASETQPEAIAFRYDGRGFYTVSEGSFAQVSFYGCK